MHSEGVPQIMQSWLVAGVEPVYSDMLAQPKKSILYHEASDSLTIFVGEERRIGMARVTCADTARIIVLHRRRKLRAERDAAAFVELGLADQQGILYEVHIGTTQSYGLAHSQPSSIEQQQKCAQRDSALA